MGKHPGGGRWTHSPRPKVPCSRASVSTGAPVFCSGGMSAVFSLRWRIGYGLWSLVGVPLVELYGYGNGFTAYQHLIEKWGVWIIIAKSLTPVPFKIMAIAAGVAAMSPTAFLASAVAGRAVHFAIVATLIALWGDRVMGLLLRYGRALAIISLLGLIGIAVVQHLR
jgi:membrane protein DedA with SNARE-associated domain